MNKLGKDGEISDIDCSKTNSNRLIRILEAPTWNSGITQFEPCKPMYKRLFHWGPLLAIGIITQIGFTTSLVHLNWWPITSISGILHFMLFLFWNYSTLNNLLKASYYGGGYVPLNWNPPKNEQKRQLQYCAICRGYKVPRSHHCSKCGRCVLKLEHHCPWINNCVGHRNQVFFIRFLASAVVGCFHAVIILIICIYRTLDMIWWSGPLKQGPNSFYIDSIYVFFSAIFAFSFASGVIVSVGILLYVQLKVVFKNKTTIEDYICLKAESRDRDAEFVYPYDLGWRENLRQVFGNGLDDFPKGNGVWWPVVEECDQFTFTVEQLEQKALKRQHAREVVITKDFSGGFCGAWRHGLMIQLCQPLSEEPRVEVQIGERWLVTRGNKRWVYGMKHIDDYLSPNAQLNNEKKENTPEDSEESRLVAIRPPRGWFPRSCARPKAE